MQFNDLVRKFFEQILNAELDVPVHATLLYEDETFEVILVPELTEEGEFTLKYYNAPAYHPETRCDESGKGTKTLVDESGIWFTSNVGTSMAKQ